MKKGVLLTVGIEVVVGVLLGLLILEGIGPIVGAIFGGSLGYAFHLVSDKNKRLP